MLKRAALIVLVAYTILLGATFDGVLNSTRRLVDVLLFGAITILWLIARRRWHWHRTPLDGAILLWCLAFLVSLTANAVSWRRIVIALWFMSTYIVVWYLLQDALANGALRRAWLVDALLIAGVPAVFVGCAQIELALTRGQPLLRPVGTLGNANALAAFLVALLPFIAGRFAKARTPLARVLFGFYGVAVLVLLGFTFSRGGWIGAAVALAVWIFLSFPMFRLWADLPRPRKISVVGVLAVGALLGAFVIIKSLDLGGRGLEFRTWIYETAIRLFADRPLTGYGLFTFGAGLSRLNSLPPLEPHSHAHDVVLNVAAELGVIGLVALVLTTWAIVRHLRKPSDPIAVMAVAAFAGFAAHQLLDMPVMMPSIALVALLLLVLAMPAQVPVNRGRWQPVLISVASLGLFIMGLWAALQYGQYIAALSDGIASGDYQTAAERLTELSKADPALAIYPEQRGILLGLAAAAGDVPSAQEAAASFAQFVQMEPSYVTGWANVAALYEQLGDFRKAADAMSHAAQLAPHSWSLLYRSGNYAEAAGDTSALSLYHQLLSLNYDVALLPDWKDTVLRRGIPISEERYSSLAQTILLLIRGETSEAQRTWKAYAGHTLDASSYHTVALMLAQAQGDPSSAAQEFRDAQNVAQTRNDRGWTHLGAALLNSEQFQPEIAAAKAALEVVQTESDWSFGANIGYLQYLRLTIPRQFLPQVGFTDVEPVLLYLLSDNDALSDLAATMHS